jgi:hypothetical protein
MTFYYWHFVAFIFAFSIVKSLNNALLHDYSKWKQRLGIPDKWDWYFNPNISWKNKNKGKLFWFITWEMVTPFSDFWHTLWTLYQIGITIDMVVLFGWIYGLVPNVISVFLIFNGIYNFMRYKKFIKL